jgi:hypothetical protein
MEMMPNSAESEAVDDHSSDGCDGPEASHLQESCRLSPDLLAVADSQQHTVLRSAPDVVSSKDFAGAASD